MSFPDTRLRRLRRTAALRDLVRETELSAARLIAPLFVASAEEPVESMPGVSRLTISGAVAAAGELAALGVPGVLLFGIPDHKDGEGSGAWDDEGVVQLAVRAIKAAHPQLLVITDVCLCEYTEPRPLRHRCAPTARSTTTPRSSCWRARRRATPAPAPTSIAPSDMMDGRVGAIRAELDAEGFTELPILAYAAKFASAFYGPFREAAGSTPAFGDRRSYQLDPGNVREALRETRARHRRGRRHPDGQARAGLPRRDRGGRARARSCRWRPTTSAASMRW